MIGAKHLIPLAVRNRLRSFLYRSRQRVPSPVDVVKANTQEAFDYFYAQDDFIAEHYLEPERIALYEIVANRCAKLLESLGDTRPVRVCDIGCGTGEMLEILRSAVPSDYKVELFGLDFANSAIAKAQKLLPAATFKVGDIYINDLPAAYFDLVLCLETLEHLQTPERALDTLLRICKPGGHLIITVPNGEKDSWEGHVNFWNFSQFAAFLGSADRSKIELVQDETTILSILRKSERPGHASEAIDSSSH